jgi:hypothetical protein
MNRKTIRLPVAMFKLGVISIIALLAGAASANSLLQDSFAGNNGSLPNPSNWTVNTTPPSSAVTLYNNQCLFQNRGYLNSQTQFNPSTSGGLNITGIWTFQSGQNYDFDYMQVLTRCSGTPDPANYYDATAGIEFLAQADQSGGIITLNDIGIEAFGSSTPTNRVSTNSGLSWGNIANVPLAFQITDDGTDLSFHLNIADDPARWMNEVGQQTALEPSTNYITFYNRETELGYQFDDLLGNVQVTTLVPEPTTLALLVLGIGAGVLRRPRRAA